MVFYLYGHGVRNDLLTQRYTVAPPAVPARLSNASSVVRACVEMATKRTHGKRCNLDGAKSVLLWLGFRTLAMEGDVC